MRYIRGVSPVRSPTSLPPFDVRSLLLADLEPMVALLMRRLGTDRLCVLAGEEDVAALGGAEAGIDLGQGARLVAGGPVAAALARRAAADGPWGPEGGLAVRVGASGGLWSGPVARQDPALAPSLATLAEVACSLVARAADLARAHARIRELAVLSTVDPLTGLRNRRYFDGVFAKEIARRRRYQRALTLLVLDLDHFKRLNDTHGHAAGDDVLRSVGAVLGAQLRASDVAVRLGGEEFAALLPETTVEAGALVAERIRRAVSAVDREGVRVTVSIGIASVEGRWDGDASALLRAADQALYEAKRRGRNRVVHVDVGEGSIDSTPV